MLVVSETNLPKSLLPSFSIIKHGKITFYVKHKYKDVLLNLDIDSLRKEAIEKGNIRFGRERHPVIHIPELAEERIIIRHSRHGGLFGYIAGDIFCKGNRFLNELIASKTAIEKGVNTAEIIAVIKQRVFGTLYRIDVLSKEISNSLDLIEFLTNPPKSPLPPLLKGERGGFIVRKNLIETVAQAVRKMHDAGLYHADLHMKNILIQSTSGDTPPCPLLLEGRNTPPSTIPSIKRGERGVLRGEKGVCEFKAYIIDMDKARTMNLVSTKLRMRNLRRLDRSVEKLKAKLSQRVRSQPPFYPPLHKGGTEGGWNSGPKTQDYESLMPSKADKLRFLLAYIGDDVEMRQYIKMHSRTYWLHRLLWRLSFVKRAR